ncbi:MAG TPA: DUF1585 domain-containing protein, partial [Steroidobacteraceae bacterium]|nr:DUF1585 domain-containing protein [Steroidobacteraceae bacterium]
RDGDSRVDARGTLVDGTNINGSDDLMKVLMARSDLFMINFTQKLMTYALGRALDYRDMPAVRSVVQQAGRENYRISTLIQAVVQSPAFRQRQVAASQVRVAAQQGRE